MRPLLVVAGAALVALGCQYNSATDPAPTTPAAQAVTAATYAYGPGDTYRVYQDQLARATSLDDVLPFLSARHRAQLFNIPADQQKQALVALQQTAIPNPHVRNVKSDGDTATLEAIGAVRRAMVTMHREGGLWRVTEEVWTTKEAAPQPAPLPSQP
jgi:hypothetical protein